MSDLGNTLVIRPGALGDALLTLPALHMLRLAGASNLVVLGTPANWAFSKRVKTGLRIRDFSSSEWLGLFGQDVPLSPAAQAALGQIHTAIVYLGDQAGGVEHVLKHAGVQTVICAAPPVASTDFQSGQHASELLMAPIQHVAGIEQTTHALALVNGSLDSDPLMAIDEHERVSALDKLGLNAAPEGGFFALHPGSGGQKKCWPAARFAKVAVELACHRNLRPLVFFGPADDAVREEFEHAIPPGIEWECASNLALREALALLMLCRGYLGNDSGFSHLAARACPAQVIFGPTNPEIWRPLGPKVKIIRAPQGKLDKLAVEDVLETLGGDV